MMGLDQYPGGHDLLAVDIHGAAQARFVAYARLARQPDGGTILAHQLDTSVAYVATGLYLWPAYDFTIRLGARVDNGPQRSHHAADILAVLGCSESPTRR
jgi:hypothetical protein